MMPFDRLVRAVDEWAHTHDEPVLAQVGDGTYSSLHMRSVAMMPPETLRRHFAEARLVIGHAGMGTIIMALELGKPLVVLPRLERLGENTSDHQTATARVFVGRPGIYVAQDEADAVRALKGEWVPREIPRLHSAPSRDLIERLSRFIADA